jgi:ribosomal protein S18 acetylase RimI-like enzyme
LKNRVQKAALSDLEAVQRLNALLRTGVRDFYWDSEGYVRSAIAGGKCFLVKKGRGEVQGAMIIGDKDPDRARGQEHLVVETLVVEPGHRGTGIGTELVEFAKRLSFERDLRLYVESFYEYGKPEYYRNIGFKKDEPQAYRGRPYHVLHFEPRPIPGFPRMKRIGIGDRLQYLHHFGRAIVVSGDLTFERVFVHDSPSRKIFVSLLNDNVVVMERSEDAVRFYPIIGCSEIDRTMLECLGWLKTRGKRGWFSGVPVDMLSVISVQARTKLRMARERGNEEFLYRTSSLFDASAADPKAKKRNPGAWRKKRPATQAGWRPVEEGHHGPAR